MEETSRITKNYYQFFVERVSKQISRGILREFFEEMFEEIVKQKRNYSKNCYNHTNIAKEISQGFLQMNSFKKLATKLHDIYIYIYILIYIYFFFFEENP